LKSAVISLNFEFLEKRFNEFRGATNTKLKSIEKCLEKLETWKLLLEKPNKKTQKN